MTPILISSRPRRADGAVRRCPVPVAGSVKRCGPRPRRLLAWSERWRATALAVPAVRPPADAEFNASLAALRQVTSELEKARRQGVPTAALERQKLRLESVVRASSLRARGTTGPGRSVVNIAELLDELGTAQLIEI